jgi:hypothetical protein
MSSELGCWSQVVAATCDSVPDGRSIRRPWSPEKEGALALGDETAGGELVDERAIHLFVEMEIETIE